MKTLQEALQNYELPVQETKAKSEWAEWVGKFTDKLNEERKGTKYEPLKYGYVADRISIYKKGEDLSEVRYFWRRCSEAKSFSATFWYFTKPNV